MGSWVCLGLWALRFKKSILTVAVRQKVDRKNNHGSDDTP